MLATCFVFADNENYDGQDVSGKTFYGSCKNSSWIGATAVDTWFQADLTNANLTNANLNKARFSGTKINVTDAIFTNANLSGANSYEVEGLTDSQLRSAADITGIQLSQIDLTNFNLSGLDFSGGNFHWSTLSNVDFTNAILDRVMFYGLKGLCDKQLRSAKSLVGLNIQSMDISEFDLSGLNFSSGGIVNSTSLNSNFTETDLTSVSFYGSTLNGSNFNGANLTSVTLRKCSLVNTNLTNANLTGATFTTETDISGATINGADLTSTVENGFTFAHLESTKSYADKNLSGVIFDYNNIGGWNLSGLNLQNTSFFASKIAGTNFSNSDLRGADISVTKGTATYKNTIMSDGVIKNFSMASADESLSIRKYTPADGGENISAKIAEDAMISGGAVLSLERGADLIVTNAKTLTVASDGAIAIDTDLSGSTKFTVDHGAGLVFENGAKLTINVMEDIVGGDALEFTVLSWYDDSYIAGLDTIKPNQTLFLNVNGAAYAGDWTYEIKGNSLNISINVPEPSTYAAILGAIALAFALKRRCSRK